MLPHNIISNLSFIVVIAGEITVFVTIVLLLLLNSIPFFIINFLTQTQRGKFQWQHENTRMVHKQQTKIPIKYNKSHLKNAVNKNNYHNNTLSYSVPAILEATSTLTAGYHVITIFKSLILLCHLHLSLF